MPTEVTLAAALRDRNSSQRDARNIAVRNLAPALVESLDIGARLWNAARERPDTSHRRDDIEAVVSGLLEAHEDRDPQIRALALVGLGQLGLPEVLALARKVIDDADAPDDQATVFARECAVIATSLLGAAARSRIGVAPTDASARATATEVRALLVAALSDTRDDVRFQAGPALAELDDRADEELIVRALRIEKVPLVAENLVFALSTWDPPGESACAALLEVLHADSGATLLGLEAALALTAAGRTEGGARLVRALSDAEHRDRALEALAVLGPRAPDSAALPVRRLATSWFTPGLTRVRAAYALARLSPSEGMALLEQLAHNPRSAVRAGVRDAMSALERFDARERAR